MTSSAVPIEVSPGGSETSAADQTEEAALTDAVQEFVRLDDELKVSKGQLKIVRNVIKNHRTHIIDYMVKNGINRLTGIKGGAQYLDCVQKTLKCRPTLDQTKSKLAELLKAGVNDPAVIMQALATCGGTRTEYRLSRRTRRVNATMAAALVAAAAGALKLGKKKNKKPMQKKRKMMGSAPQIPMFVTSPSSAAPK